LSAQLLLLVAIHRGNLASVRDGALKFDLVELRQLKKSDARRLQALLIKDRAWLSPWEATTPGIRYPVDARDLVRNLLYQQRKGTGLAFIIEVDGALAGQINVANILYGSVSSATVGYWIGKDFAGRGAMPIAVALTIDYLFDELGLHRVEIDIRPENEASLRVVEKLKLREEGLKERFIHIDGQWRDHRVFAITSEERKGSMLGRLDNTLDQ
jgi:ribosomal-protein-alanine N-acetyltransferase